MATIWLAGACECDYLQKDSDQKQYLCHKNKDNPVEVDYYDCKACGKLDVYEMFFDGSDD